MNRFEEAILEEFAEAYPGSAHFRGGRRLRLGGWEKRLTDIAGDVEAKDAFLSDAEELESRGVISVKWTRFREGTEVEAIFLEQPEAVYRLLGRRSPNEIRIQMLDVLASEPWMQLDREHQDLVTAIREYLHRSLADRQQIPVSTPEELRDLAEIISIPIKKAESLPIRALSTRLFHDSKRLERLLPMVDAVARRTIGKNISFELGLSRSYPEVSFSLFGDIEFTGSDSRRWQCRGEVHTVPAETVSLISEIRILASGGNPCVISVENKETFYSLSRNLMLLRPAGFRLPIAISDAQVFGLVYTAGHPNPAVVALLRAISCRGLQLLHFGDLDPDGLLIVIELAKFVESEIVPVLMDIEIYRRYSEYGYQIGDNAIDRLESARDKIPTSLLPLADALFERRIGVEQEVIDVGLV